MGNHSVTCDEFVIELCRIDCKDAPNESIDLCLKNGISDQVRGRFWTFLARSEIKMIENGIGFYDKLDKTIEGMNKILIEKDFPRLVQEKGPERERKIKRMLATYLNYDSKARYVSVFLIVLNFLEDFVEDEEQCFWLFRQIMIEYHWREMISNYENIQALLKEVDLEISRISPSFEKFLCSNGLSSLQYAYTPIATIFIYRATRQAASSIMDLFLRHGHIILHKIAARHILNFEKRLIKMQRDEFYHFIFTSLFTDLDVSVLYNLCVSS